MNVLALRATPRDGQSFTPRNRRLPVRYHRFLIFAVCFLLASFSPASRATVAISHRMISLK